MTHIGCMNFATDIPYSGQTQEEMNGEGGGEKEMEG